MRTLYFCPVVSSSFYLFLFLAYSQTSRIVCLPYLHTWCGLNTNLGCRSEMCCTRLAENTGRKKSPKIRHLYHRTTLSGYILATKAHIDNRIKLVKQQYLLQCPLQYAELRRPLTAEIGLVVWGIPANFNGFRVLAALRR